MKKTIVVAVALLILSVAAQFELKRARNAVAPALTEGAYAALGGLRSMAAEVIWFRADRLQAEGRYVELAELTDLLTRMEPHTPEVWSYAAWNLAYNVSSMMPMPEDRWRWVLAGMRLLRDEGLALNPGDPEITHELAWIFELKLAADLDSAAAVYRMRWRELVEDARVRGAWKELGMDERKMREVEAEGWRWRDQVRTRKPEFMNTFTSPTVFGDWTDPALSAVYWAMEGLARANSVERKRLESVIFESFVLYANRHEFR